MPYAEGSYQPYLFRRWSAHTHTYSNTGSISSGSGHSAAAATTFSSMGGYGSGGSGVGVSSHTGLTPYSFNRRWSVPASVNQQTGSTTGLKLNVSVSIFFAYDWFPLISSVLSCRLWKEDRTFRH